LTQRIDKILSNFDKLAA
jgi:hypothetical protein